ncbi:MAG: hypothetical protein P3W94_008300, partial [Paracoccus sp. (in: a-proteobacteria)]|nr:hypothetical protein [Paracoccus sp. (in: a-proteobacteria)]
MTRLTMTGTRRAADAQFAAYWNDVTGMSVLLPKASCDNAAIKPTGPKADPQDRQIQMQKSVLIRIGG